MLNREERRGVLWIAFFIVVVAGLLVAFMWISDPLANPPRTTARTDRAEISLGRLDGEVFQTFTREALTPEVRVLGLGGLSSHWLEDPSLDAPQHFLVNGLPASTDFTLEVSAPGCETRSFPARVLPDRITHLGKITLRPLVAPAARAQSGSGKPLAGASLELRAAGGEVLQAVRTDGDGLARFAPLPADRFLLGISGGGWIDAAPAPLDARRLLPRDPVVVVAARGLAGEVLFTGPELPGTVRVGALQAGGAAGRFRLAGLAAGMHWGIASGPKDRRTLFVASLPGATGEVPLPPVEEWQVHVEGGTQPVWVAARSSLPGATSMAFSVAGGTGPATTLALHSSGQRVEFVALDGSGAFATASVPAATGRGAPLEIHLTLSTAEATATLPAGSELRLFPWGPLEAQRLRLDHPASVAALDAELVLAEVPVPVPGGDALAASPAWLAAHGAELDARLPLQGTVRDGERPVAGARVSTFAVLDAVPQLLDTAFTTEDGSFVLQRPAVAFESTLLVEAQGYARAAQPLGDVRQLTVRLAPEALLALKLVDEDGAPLAGGVALRFGPPWSDLPLAPGNRRGVLQAFADASGEVLVSGLAAGAPPAVEPAGALAGVLEPPLAPLRSGAPAEPATLHCYVPRSLSGSVLDPAGEAVSGATVRLQAAALYADCAPAPCTTSSAGSFQWHGLPPPPWSVLVTAAGFSPGTWTLPESPEPCVLHLEPLAPPP